MLTTPSVLVFGRDAVKKRYFSCTFHMENRHPKLPIIFKFLTNGRRTHRFAVNPSCGVVHSMENLKITILAREFDNFGEPLNSETVKKTRFTIVWQYVPPSLLEEILQFQSLKEAMKTIQETGRYESCHLNTFVILEDKDGDGNERIPGILGEGDGEIKCGSSDAETSVQTTTTKLGSPLDKKTSMDIISSIQENQLQGPQEFDAFRREAAHLMSLATEHSIMELHSQLKFAKQIRGFLYLMLLILLGLSLYCIPQYLDYLSK